MTLLPPSQGKDAIRRVNLSAMLGSLVREQARSRTELVERLALSRTTVAELAAHLTELGLVEERAPDVIRGVGRPSTVVHPRGDVVAFAVDPEVDAVSVAAVGLDGEIVASRRETPRDIGNVGEVVARVAGAVDALRVELPDSARVAGCGVAVPGQIDPDSGRVIAASSVGWRDVDLAGLLRERIEMPVWLGNNARLMMRAEQLAGAARGHDDIVSIFAGAGGIGGGAVSGGVTVAGAGGFAGEVGSLRVVLREPDGGLSTGSFGQLVRRDRLVAALGLGSADDATLDAAIASADIPAFVDLARRYADVIADVLSDLTSLFNPSVVILGGFLGALHRRFAPDIEARVAAQVVEPSRAAVRVAPASDVTRMVLLGAAHAVWDDVIADPIGFALQPARGR